MYGGNCLHKMKCITYDFGVTINGLCMHYFFWAYYVFIKHFMCFCKLNEFQHLYMHSVIASVLQVNVIIVELKSEALKERHWKQLMRRLCVNWVLSELTLGHIWDINLQKHEQIVRDVIMVAQGEMALEEFLKQVCLHAY